MRAFARKAAGTLAAAAALAASFAAPAQDPGWPRVMQKDGVTLEIHAPQVDEWTEFRSLQWRSAVQLTTGPGAKPVVGAVGLHADTLVDTDGQQVLLAGIRITRASFPGLEAAAAKDAQRALEAFLPKSTTVALSRIVASTPKPATAPAAAVRNDPPAIFTSTSPALLLAVDGKPVLAKIPDTSLAFVVNVHVPLFSAGGAYYLLAGEAWLRADALPGPWAPAPRLPAAFDALAKDPSWADVARRIPPGRAGSAPRVFYSEGPAEVILFDGKPDFKRVPDTALLYASNTESTLFLHEGSRQYFYLTSGRWYRAASLEGPWAFATAELPADFARIPPTGPVGHVLAAVPGTEEAKDAVLMAQVPTRLEVAPGAAAQVKVAYDGAPQFAPIPGTALAYATNTPDKVIRVGEAFYLCLQGVWFVSPSPQGPWKVAGAVPKEIYAIPPSSPVYNVTYVTQVTTPTGSVQASYTAGYMGAFVVGTAVGYSVAYGSGYYYPPYIYYPPAGYPVYRPYPMPYAAPVYTATGAWGWSQTAYGPYGSATRAATYNPYTGTAARGATVSGPYGSRSAAQAYNPYTGTYAATRQGSSPTAQWGSSVVTHGNQAAYAQHYSTAAGTVGSVQTSAGGAMAGVSGAGGTDVKVGKTASGDYYAAKDGNVYRNTGSGWQSYDNGNWNAAQKPAASGQGASGAGAHGQQVQSLQHEAGSRERGGFQAQQHESRGTGGRSGGRRR